MASSTTELLQMLFFCAVDCTLLTLKQSSSPFSVIYGIAPVEESLDPIQIKGITESNKSDSFLAYTGVV